MLVGVSVALLVAAGLVDRMSRIPLIRSRKLAVCMVASAFGVLWGCLSLAGLWTDWRFMVISAICAAVWLGLGYVIRRRRAGQLRFGLVEAGQVRSLRGIKSIDWVPLGPDLEQPPDVQAVVVDLHGVIDEAWARSLTVCRLNDIPVIDASFLYESLKGRVQRAWVNESQLAAVRTARRYDILKRAFDLILCVMMAPVVIPLIGCAIVAIRLDSGGPAFFLQDRVGLDGCVFRIVKLRTMQVARDGATFASNDDERITAVGRILRRLRIDECPQIWNVVKGDMSIVGPRPEQRSVVEAFEREIPFFSLRHLVRPGITGWAQVHYGYASDEEESRRKLEYDLFYLKHWSFVLDAMILLRTALVVATGRGAR